MSDKAPLPDLDALIQQLRGDLFIRWMRRAQKQALIEWRDRKETPGLAARFTNDGRHFYNFGERMPKYQVAKGDLPDFVKTGALRDAMKTRRPRSTSDSSGEVVTRIRYGGGALNFMTTTQGVVAINRVVERKAIPIAGYTVERAGRFRYYVPPSTQTRQLSHKVAVRGGPTYTDEFRRFNLDQPWIAARTSECFRAIVRASAFTKRGELRSNMFIEADHG